jgi:hypothetical protein
MQPRGTGLYMFPVSLSEWETRYEVAKADVFVNTKPVISCQIACDECTRAYIFFRGAFETKTDKNAPISVAMPVCPSLGPHVTSP